MDQVTINIAADRAEREALVAQLVNPFRGSASIIRTEDDSQKPYTIVVIRLTGSHKIRRQRFMKQVKTAAKSPYVDYIAYRFYDSQRVWSVGPGKARDIDHTAPIEEGDLS